MVKCISLIEGSININVIIKRVNTKKAIINIIRVSERLHGVGIYTITEGIRRMDIEFIG